MKMNKKLLMCVMLTATAILSASCIIIIFDNNNTKVIDNNDYFGENYDINPDLDFQLNTSKDELWRILGHIGGYSHLTITTINGDTYTLTGDLTDEIKQFKGRKMLILTKPIEGEDYKIEVLEYEVLPYTVLTGNLTIKEITRMGVTTEYIILTTILNGKEYEFQLIDTDFELIIHDENSKVTGYIRDNYIGKEITVAGIITCTSYTGYNTFDVYKIFEHIPSNESKIFLNVTVINEEPPNSLDYVKKEGEPKEVYIYEAVPDPELTHIIGFTKIETINLQKVDNLTFVGETYIDRSDVMLCVGYATTNFVDGLSCVTVNQSLNEIQLEVYYCNCNVALD